MNESAAFNESAVFRDIVGALRTGNPVEAERLSRSVLELAPGHVDAMLSLALSLHAQRRIADALDAYQRLTELQPASSVHWANYATILAEAGRSEESESAWRKAMELDPRDPEPRIQIGQLLLARKEYLEAREGSLPPCHLQPSVHDSSRRAQPWRGSKDVEHE